MNSSKLISKYKVFISSIMSIKWERAWVIEEVKINEIEKLYYKRKGNVYLNNSIQQFKAQAFGIPWYTLLAIQILSIFSLVYLLIKGLSRKVSYVEKKEVAYFYDINIFSERVREGKSLVFISSNELMLTGKDLFYILSNLVKTNFNFKLISTLTFRIGQARFSQVKYDINEMWVNMEYSAASGLLHGFCVKEDILLCNFMHGEKLLTTIDAFCSFDKFYVWNRHYEQLFKSLKANAEIIIDNPWELKEKKNILNTSKKVCYFMKGIETLEEIQLINSSLRHFSKIGYDVYYKKHPRQVNFNKLDDSFIEYNNFINNNIPVLYEFDFIIAQFSTILFQCYCNNQAILLDDISNAKLVHALADRHYFLLENEDVKLSKFLNFE